MDLREWNVVLGTSGGVGGGIVGWNGNNEFNAVIGCITHFFCWYEQCVAVVV
jgi:hypothetical protein